MPNFNHAIIHEAEMFSHGPCHVTVCDCVCMCVCQLCPAGPQWRCCLQRTGSIALSRQPGSSATLWRTRRGAPETSVSPCWTYFSEVALTHSAHHVTGTFCLIVASVNFDLDLLLCDNSTFGIMWLSCGLMTCWLNSCLFQSQRIFQTLSWWWSLVLWTARWGSCPGISDSLSSCKLLCVLTSATLTCAHSPLTWSPLHHQTAWNLLCWSNDAKNIF